MSHARYVICESTLESEQYAGLLQNQLVLSCGHAVTEDMVAKDDWPSADCVTTVRSFGCEAVCV